MGDIRQVVEKLERLAGQYNSSLQKLGELMDEIAEWTAENYPAVQEFSYKLLRYDRVGKESNIGTLGPSFWYDDELVSTTRTPGNSFYLHGDFQAYVPVAGRTERRKAAEMMPSFLEAFAKHIEESTQAHEGIAEKLQAVLEALQQD